MIFDLDAHFKSGENGDLLRRLVEGIGPRTSVLVGGGLTTLAAASRWLDYDPRIRALLGDAASRDPGLVRGIAATYGRHRLYLGVNHTPDSRVEETLERVNGLGPSAAGVIVTDLSRDATGAGLDIDLFRTLCREARAPLIAAGGLARKEEIRDLKAVGAAGVVVGKAIFDRRYTLRELLHEGRR
jgi:phosphoribosylformimino-5-aminoimidazole carboxamide ribotide isomerase